MTSIRRRLLVWLLLPLTLVLLGADAITFIKAREELLEVLDRELEAAALAAADPAARLQASTARGRVIQIRNEQGRLLYDGSANGLPSSEQSGPSTMSWQGEDWRAFVLRRDGRTVQVAEPLEAWRRHANAAAFEIVKPLTVVILPLFALVIWLGVSRSLRPVTSIATSLKARQPASLEPITERGLPEEILPLVQALNDLLHRLSELLEGQRRFIADAAHELRTPLSAIQLQVENLEKAITREEGDAAIQQLKAGVPRAARLVQQLLTMARLTPEEVGQREFEQVDIEQLVKSVLVDYEPFAGRCGIDLGLARTEPFVMQADGESLRIMLGNLLDNALHYTPEGGIVDVRLWREGREAIIEVTDTGPGIPVNERERVFQRFYRGQARTGQGSGLGLSIVDQIVKLHRGRIYLREGDNGKGLKATVRLPVLRDASS